MALVGGGGGGCGGLVGGEEDGLLGWSLEFWGRLLHVCQVCSKTMDILEEWRLTRDPRPKENLRGMATLAVVLGEGRVFGTLALRLSGSQRVQMRVPAMGLGMGLEWRMAWGMSYDSRGPEMKQYRITVDYQENAACGLGCVDCGQKEEGRKQKAESRRQKAESRK